MSSIDNRIVEMEFNNKRFEENARQSMSTLDKLKEKLNFRSATKELEEFQNASDSFNLSRIASAVEEIGNKFTLMGNLGYQAMQRIANAALNAGTALIKSISIDQISAGMSKYEQETNVIQTLYGALKPKGTQLSEIYDAMELLTKYSDETSYSYTQMADAVSKFVNAGIDLRDAETMIEGVSNAAALAGIGIHDTAIIYRNFADAIGKGSFKLQDWKSIQIAHMNTEWLKQAFIDEAIAQGKLAKNFNIKDFENSLSKGWLDTKVMQNVLNKYANRELKGFGQEAFAAAQNAKTFTDVIDALKDSVSTGWSRSFRIIFGDLKEAIAFFTPMANTVIEFTAAIDEFRNNILTSWKNLGGRDSMISALSEIWHSFTRISDAFSHGFIKTFLNSFYPTWSDVEKSIEDGAGASAAAKMGYEIAKITKNIQKAAEAFNDWLTGHGTETGASRLFQIETIFQGIFSVINIIRMALGGVGAFFKAIFKQLQPTFDAVLYFFSIIGSDLSQLNKKLAQNKTFEKLGKDLSKIFEPLTSRLPNVIHWVTDLYKRIKKFWKENPRFVAFRKSVANVFNAIIGFIPKAIESLIDFGKSIVNTVKNSDEWKTLMQNYNRYIKPWLSKIEVAATLFNNALADFFNMDTSDEKTLWGKIKKRFSVFDKLGPWFNQQWELLKKDFPWLQKVEDWWNTDPVINEIKRWVLRIAKAIDAFLSADTSGESSIAGKIKKRFEAMWNSIGPWLTVKWEAFKKKYPIVQQIEDFLKNLFGVGKEADKSAGESKKGTNKITEWLGQFWDKVKEFAAKIDPKKLALFGVAIAILIKVYKLARSLFGWASVGENIADAIESAGGFIDQARKSLKKSNMMSSVTAILEVAASIWLLGDTLTKVAKLSWEEIAKGLTAMAGLFVEEGAFMILMTKFNTGKGKAKPLQMIAIALSMKILGSALKDVSQLSWDQIGRGLTAMAGLFVEEGAFMIIVNRFGSTGFWKRKGTSALSMIALAYSMKILGDTLMKVSKLTWDEIGRGLAVMGGLFLESGAFMILVNRFGSVDFWKKKGATATSMTSTAKMIQSLADTLQKLAKMTWDDIKKGLITMGGLFLESGAFMVLVNRLGATSEKHKGLTLTGIIGTTGSIYVLADKLKELGALTWDQIIHGLAAMAGIFAEEGIFMVLVNRLSKAGGIDAGMMNAAIGVLAFGIGSMGDAMAKLGQMSWDEILKGSVAMLAIEALLGVFVYVMGKINKTVKVSQGLGMAIVAGAIWLLVQAFMPLTTISWDQFEVGIASLASVAVVLGVFCAVMTKMKLSIKTTLGVIISAIALAALMVAFAFSLTLIKDVDTTQILAFGAAMLLVSGAMAILAATLQIFSKLSLGAAIKGTLIMVIAAAGLAAAVALILEIVGTAIADFSDNIAVVGSNLSLYSEMVEDINMEAVNNSVQMIKDLAAAFVEIGAKSYGNIETFRSNMTLMGSSLKLFYLQTQSVTSDQVEAMAKTITSLSDTFVAIGGKEYGVIDTFRSNMTRVGSGLKLMYLQVQAVDSEKITAISSLLSSLSDLFLSIGGKDYGNLETFRSNLTRIASSLKLFNAQTQEIGSSTISSTTGLIKTISETFAETGSKDYGNVGTFRTYMSRMGSSLKLFNTNTSELDTTKMKSVTEALKGMADDLANFPEVTDIGTSIANIGGAIKLYSESISGATLDNAPDSTQIKKVFDTLKDALPSDDETLTEVAGYATGDKGSQMTNFAIGLTNIATAVNDFSKNVETMDFEKVDKAVAALVAISQINTNLNSGMASNYDSVAGEVKEDASGLDTFAADFVNLGTAVSDFGVNIQNTDFGQVDKAVAALVAISKLNPNLTSGMASNYSGVAGEVKEDASGLDTFAADLSTLGAAVADFGEKVKEADFSQVDKAVAALNAISQLNPNLASGMASNYSSVASEAKEQSSGLDTFATDLSTLGSAVADFGTSVKDTDFGQVDKAISALDAINKLNTGLETTTITSFGPFATEVHTQKQSMSTFAEDIIALGTALNDFGTNISKVNTEDLTTGTTVLEKIVEVNKALPPTGGISRWLIGSRDLTRFAANLKLLGEGAKSFGESISGGTFNATEIGAAGDALIKIAQVNKELPKTGGISSWFTGDKSLGSFASNLKTLGEGCKGFADGLGDTKFSENATGAMDFIRKMSNIQVKFGKIENWYSLAAFGSEFNQLVTSATQANETLADMTLGWEDPTDLLTFVNGLADVQVKLGNITFRKSLKDFGNEFKEMLVAIYSFTQDTGWFGSTENNKLQQLADILADMLRTLDIFNADDGKLILDGEAIVSAIAQGIGDDVSKTNLTNTMDRILSTIIIKVRGYEQNFKAVGTWIPKGLGDGIWENRYAAINAAIDVMNAAIEAAEDTAGVASPSKVFAEIGMYSDIGLAQGLLGSIGLVDTAAGAVSQTAIDTVLNGMREIQNLPLDRIETTPTIRPVLDTSYISSRARMIDGVLGETRTIGFNTRKLEAEAQLLGESTGSDISIISQQMAGLREQLDDLKTTIANIKMVVDTGALVGAMESDIDKSLGARSRRSGRGN